MILKSAYEKAMERTDALSTNEAAEPETASAADDEPVPGVFVLRGGVPFGEVAGLEEDERGIRWATVRWRDVLLKERLPNDIFDRPSRAQVAYLAQVALRLRAELVKKVTPPPPRPANRKERRTLLKRRLDELVSLAQEACLTYREGPEAFARANALREAVATLTGTPFSPLARPAVWTALPADEQAVLDPACGSGNLLAASLEASRIPAELLAGPERESSGAATAAGVAPKRKKTAKSKGKRAASAKPAKRRGKTAPT